MAFKPIDGKRDEIRKYLERTGVLEAISKVFVKLVICPERPENAIEFVRQNLGDTLHQNDTIEHLKQELEDARSEIALLKRTIENLKAENSKTINISEEEEKLTTPSNNEDSINATVNKVTSSEVPEEQLSGSEQIDTFTANSEEVNDQESETQNSSNKDESNNKPSESN